VPIWFAPDETGPLLCFAGLWTNWTSVRKAREGEVTADVFSFLTCQPNAEVARVHLKAVPVIMMRKSATCACAPPGTSKAVQRPLPDGSRSWRPAKRRTRRSRVRFRFAQAAGTGGKATDRAIRNPWHVLAAGTGDGPAGFVSAQEGISMLMMKQKRTAIRTLRGWAISVLHEAGAIRECEEHGWMMDRTDPEARRRALAVARQDPPPGVSPQEAVAAIEDVLVSIGDTCPECLPADEV
jgi:hypothetical protein